MDAVSQELSSLWRGRLTWTGVTLGVMLGLTIAAAALYFVGDRA